jgi:hypothetical protein
VILLACRRFWDLSLLTVRLLAEPELRAFAPDAVPSCPFELTTTG